VARAAYSIVVYTPLKWIEYEAAVAHRQLRPFTYADVTPVMREPILRVMAYPSRADYITGTGLSMSSSVTITYACFFALPLMIAQQPALQPTSATEAPSRDTSYIDANGTAHINRVVLVPRT
jgi:hypothetical protein